LFGFLRYKEVQFTNHITEELINKEMSWDFFDGGTSPRGGANEFYIFPIGIVYSK
jgi:hypothetical protein